MSNPNMLPPELQQYACQKVAEAPADARANRKAAKNTVKSPAKLVKNRKNTPANKDKT